MAGRIDYAISLTPIITGSALEGTTPEAVEADFGRSLGGGNSSKTWAGTTTGDEWAAGVHQHAEAYTTLVEVGVAAGDMLWIKHTGKRYDSSTADNLKADGTLDAVAVDVYVEASITAAEYNDGAGSSAAGGPSLVQEKIATLASGEAMVLPKPTLRVLIGSASTTGSAPAVEWADFS